MVITYTNKRHDLICNDDVSADIFSYTISEEDMNRLNNDLQADMEPKYIFMTEENSNSYDILVDNLSVGRLVIGGIIQQEYVLRYYIVYSGLPILLSQLHLPC